MDGIKLMLECSSEEDIQNRFYNGWTCNNYIGAVLVFCPDGTIPICCYNVPGTIHDSNIAIIGKIYDKLEDIYCKQAKCMVNLAYACKNYPILIKSCKPTKSVTFDEIVSMIPKGHGIEHFEDIWMMDMSAINKPTVDMGPPPIVVDESMKIMVDIEMCRT